MCIINFKRFPIPSSSIYVTLFLNVVMGLFGVYITYEQQEVRGRLKGQGETISIHAITQKNRLAEMVAETKKKILQGALTVSP